MQKIMSVCIFVFVGFFIANATMTERLDAKFLQARSKIRLGEDWKFQSGNTAGSEASTISDASWSTISIPHDMAITLVSPSSSDPSAVGWYRKHFTVSPSWAGKKVIAQFDGAYHDAKVYLNGKQVGAQEYGYVSFTCDLTANLNATGDNVLAVLVDNKTVKTSRWYSGSGIFRHVWLIATDMVYVKNWGTAVTTPTASVASSQIKIQTEIVNDLATSQTRTLETVIFDAAGTALKTDSLTITANAHSIDTCNQTVTLSSCKLWSIATPVMYYAYTRILTSNVLSDDYITPFGIRQIAWDASKGLTINGESVKMKGVCTHDAFVPAGAAVPEGLYTRVIKELQASGCNSIRTSHNPYAPEFYDLCDQMGMLVMDEWCDKWSQTAAGNYYQNWDANWKNDLSLFTQRDRNHPSIVMWSVGNEVASAAAVPTYIFDNLKLIVPYIKNIDKTRPVTHACVAGWSDAAGLARLSTVEDVVGINYQDWAYSQMHSSSSNAVFVGTEQYPYLSSNVPTWYNVKKASYVVGQHIWTGTDYLGESGNQLGSASGYLDNCLFRKTWFYYEKSLLSETPTVHIGIGSADLSDGNSWGSPNLSESWNQSGSVNVVTYTNCESVDLYVNSTKIGSKNLSGFSQNNIMQWPSVQWQSGVIKAVGMKGGVQVAVDSIVTTGADAKVVCNVDRTTLYADGADAACIEAYITDANGNHNWSATGSISYTVAGAGRSLGIGSGDWRSSESFKASSRKAYNGRVLILVQSTPTPGTITVTVNSGTLTPATVTLTTVPQGNTPIGYKAPSAASLAQTGEMLSCFLANTAKGMLVNYRINTPGTVNISVISPSGKTIKNLTNQYREAGTYSIVLNQSLRSGVYLVVMKMKTERFVQKILVSQ